MPAKEKSLRTFLTRDKHAMYSDNVRLWQLDHKPKIHESGTFRDHLGTFGGQRHRMCARGLTEITGVELKPGQCIEAKISIKPVKAKPRAR